MHYHVNFQGRVARSSTALNLKAVDVLGRDSLLVVQQGPGVRSHLAEVRLQKSLVEGPSGANPTGGFHREVCAVVYTRNASCFSFCLPSTLLYSSILLRSSLLAAYKKLCGRLVGKKQKLP